MRNQQRTFGDRTLSSLLGLAVLAVWVVPLEAQISRRAPGTRMPAVEGPGLLIGSRLDDATPPSNITTAATATSITLSWPAVAGASSYSICRGTPPGCSNLTSAPITATQITDSGLTPGTPYTYSVSAARPDGHYGSATVPAATKPPVNPSNFKAAVQSGGQVVLTWDAVPDAKFYYLQGDQLKGQSLTTTTHTVSGLSGGTFAYQLVAEYGNQPLAGVGDYRNPARITATVPRWRGQYRITLNGFSVMHETWDHALQVDGKRDEVYLDGRGTEIDKFLKEGTEFSVGTDVHGDINGLPGRVQAGSASDQGGIQSGDKFPSSTPWVRSGPTSGNSFPRKMWEGPLVADSNAVAFTFGLWEFDGGKDVYDEWVKVSKEILGMLRSNATVQKMVSEKGKTVMELADLGLSMALTLNEAEIQGNAVDRPIGSTPSQYRPQLFTLNLATAERALATDYGFGPGILELPPLKDDPKYAGHYKLYLQIERIQ